MKQLSTYFAAGSISQNAVITELSRQLYNRGEMPGMYFFRDCNGNEVDTVLEQRLLPCRKKWNGLKGQKEILTNICTDNLNNQDKIKLHLAFANSL